MRKNIFLQLILCLIISSCTKNDSDVKTEYFQEGLTWLPENPDADSELTINFKASTKSKLYGYTGDVYVHIGIVSENVWTFVPAEWNENIAKCKMTKKEDNCWSISLTPSIREWFASGETVINKLGIVIRSSDGSKKGIEEDSFSSGWYSYKQKDKQNCKMPQGRRSRVPCVE